MINRSAVAIGRRAAFHGWLKTAGINAEAIAERKRHAARTVYLIPPCRYEEELEEVIEDLFEEIFRRELSAWRLDETVWPDTGDFDLFTRWFTVEGFPLVDDVGHNAVEPERDATR